MESEKMTLDLDITQDQAWILELFCKRLGWSEFRGLAVDDGEAYSIRASVDKLQLALARAGFAPR